MIVGFIVTSTEKAMSWTMIVFGFVDGSRTVKKEGKGDCQAFRAAMNTISAASKPNKQSNQVGDVRST